MAQSPSLDVRFFEPPAALQSHVRTIYRLDVDLADGATISDQLLPEWGNIRYFSAQPAQVEAADGMEVSLAVSRSRLQASGPTSRPIRFTIGANRVWGVGLLPLGWASYVKAPAHSIANSVVDATTHAGFARLAGLLEALDTCGEDDLQGFAAIADYLVGAERTPRQEGRIRAAQEAMFDPFLLHIPEFAARAGVSTRTLERMCQNSFGFTPNILLRRQRLIRSLAAFMNDKDACWSEAIDRHYHDQPHFVREFHYFMGMSPTEYAEGDHPIMEAFMEYRQRIWGSPAKFRSAIAPKCGQASPQDANPEKHP